MQTKFINAEQMAGSGSHFYGARTLQSAATPESPTLRTDSMPFFPWTLLRHWKVRALGYPGHNSQPDGTRQSKIGFLLGAALLAALSGTVGCVYETRHAGYAEAPPVYAVAEADYVYYPAYQVYYSNSRHQYRYQEGHSWVWRPTPPRVSANVLYSSPSVRLDFHDAPERHHTTVVKQYPRNWAPPSHGNQGGHDPRQQER